MSLKPPERPQKRTKTSVVQKASVAHSGIAPVDRVFGVTAPKARPLSQPGQYARMQDDDADPRLLQCYLRCRDISFH